MHRIILYIKTVFLFFPQTPPLLHYCFGSGRSFFFISVHLYVLFAELNLNCVIILMKWMDLLLVYDPKRIAAVLPGWLLDCAPLLTVSPILPFSPIGPLSPFSPRVPHGPSWPDRPRGPTSPYHHHHHHHANNNNIGGCHNHSVHRQHPQSPSRGLTFSPLAPGSPASPGNP